MHISLYRCGKYCNPVTRDKWGDKFVGYLCRTLHSGCPAARKRRPPCQHRRSSWTTRGVLCQQRCHRLTAALPAVNKHPGHIILKKRTIMSLNFRLLNSMQTAKSINELLLMQFYLFHIRPKLHHRKWRTLCVTVTVNMHALFLACSFRDDNVITSKPTWELKHTNSILEYFEYFCQIIRRFSQLVSRSVGQWVSQSVGQSVSRSVGQSG